MTASIGGHELVVDAEHAAFWNLVSQGAWEPATIAALTAILGPGDVFIDIGAWVGPTSLLAAAEGAAVLAYEPDPDALRGLRRNLELNPALAVDVRPVALYDRDGHAVMAASTGHLGDSTTSLVAGMAGSDSTHVETVDVRHLVQSDEFKSTRLVKIDVEGAEFVLIRRLAPHLGDAPPTMLLSLHGLHFRSKFHRVPAGVRRPLQRAWSTAARLALLLRLRRYRHRYVRDDLAAGMWREARLRDLAHTALGLGETELLLAAAPLEPPGR